MESTSHSNAVVNGVGSVKPKVSRSSPEANNSPYSQSVSSIGKSGHGSDLTRRRSQKDKPAIPAKPPLSTLPPPKLSKTNGTTTTVTTTTVHSKSQSQVVGSTKPDAEGRVNGSEAKKNGDLNGDVKSSNGKGRVCLEITLEKKTPTVRRKATDRESVRSTASSSDPESSPSQSPTKSVHFKSSRSNSASSLDSRDRLRLSSTPGSQPRYQSHTISSADKSKGRTRSAAGRTGLETNGDAQLNGSSSSTSVEPLRRGRARSTGPIRRVRSNEMMSSKRDPSLSPKSGTISTTHVRSKSVERSRNRQSFGGFVQRQRQAWEERVTTVTKKQLDNVSEKSGHRRSMDPNHAPKIMQKSVTVTERKHMLFGKGANVQKVKSTIDGNQVSKPTSPTLLQKSDASQQVPKQKSSSSDSESHTSKKTEASGRATSKGNAQGDNIPSCDQNRTSTVDNSSEKSTVLQEIAPSPSSKPNAPSSLPIKPIYQNADSNYRVSPSKENKLDTLVADIDVFAGNAADETDNGKIHLFIEEDSMLGKPDSQRCKPQSSNHQEGFTEILSLTDPKEINKLNSETLQSLKKVDNTFVEVDKKDVKKDLAKEKEKAGISNGEDVGEKDGHYFVRVVNEEQSRIEALCRKVEDDLECDMPDEG